MVQIKGYWKVQLICLILLFLLVISTAHFGSEVQESGTIATFERC